MADGTRRRVYCKICLKQGKDWLTSEPCEHILQAEPNPCTTNEPLSIEAIQSKLEKAISQESDEQKSA